MSDAGRARRGGWARRTAQVRGQIGRLEADKPLWEHDLDGGWRMIGLGVRTRLVTAHHAVPLMLRSAAADSPGLVVEMTDGTFEAMLENFRVREENWRDAVAEVPGFAISESPTYVGRGVAALAGDADHGRYAGASLTSFDLAAGYGLTDVDGSRPDCWRLIAEHGFDHEHVGVTGYR